MTALRTSDIESWEGEGGAASALPGASAISKDHTTNETNRIMNIRPLYDRIVVKRIEEQETTRHGIIIPDSAKEKPQEGEVMAVGHVRGSRTAN